MASVRIFGGTMSQQINAVRIDNTEVEKLLSPFCIVISVLTSPTAFNFLHYS